MHSLQRAGNRFTGCFSIAYTPFFISSQFNDRMIAFGAVDAGLTPAEEVITFCIQGRRWQRGQLKPTGSTVPALCTAPAFMVQFQNGAILKWLRGQSAKLPCVGSNPTCTSSVYRSYQSAYKCKHIVTISSKRNSTKMAGKLIPAVLFYFPSTPHSSVPTVKRVIQHAIYYTCYMSLHCY